MRTFFSDRAFALQLHSVRSTNHSYGKEHWLGTHARGREGGLTTPPNPRLSPELVCGPISPNSRIVVLAR